MFTTRWVQAGSRAVALIAFGSVVASAQSVPGWKTDFTRHAVPLSEILDAGPPKDGIPAIDRPQFESVTAAGRWLGTREPVMVVDLGGEARAYPLQILIWHEIVNDVVAGVPIAVTYCPLCNTAITFSRVIAPADTTTFGTTGRLRLSDLVMYDRSTESWWQQATGEGLVGQHTGGRLQRVPSTLVSFAEFRREYPDGKVLSRQTGHDRPYGRNPYLRYDAPQGGPMAALFGRAPDLRLPAMERVLVVADSKEPIVIPFTHLARERVVPVRRQDGAVVVWWTAGTSSSVDSEIIAEGRDVGAASAWSPVVDGRSLTFEASGTDRFRDRQTGSTWSLLGRAVAGPLQGKQLTPVDHGAYFWFAVAAFWPEASLVGRSR